LTVFHEFLWVRKKRPDRKDQALRNFKKSKSGALLLARFQDPLANVGFPVKTVLSGHVQGPLGRRKLLLDIRIVVVATPCCFERVRGAPRMVGDKRSEPDPKKTAGRQRGEKDRGGDGATSIPAMTLVLVAPISPFMACPVVGKSKEAPNSFPPIAKPDGDKDAKIIKKTTRQERCFFMDVLLLKMKISLTLI